MPAALSEPVRILLTTHPAYGHFHPLLPLAHAAQAAGHDAAFATSAMFRSVIEGAGFTAFDAGLKWLESDDSSIPDELQPTPGSSLEAFFAQKFVAATAEPLARGVIETASNWRPDVIVRERTEFGGALAAEVLGIPCAAVQVASPSLMTPAFLRAVAGPYNVARTHLGLPADDGLLTLDDEVVFAFAPPSLHDPAVPLPRKLVSLRPAALDATASAALPSWADEIGRDRPLVYATLGTVFNNPEYDLPFFPAVMEGLRYEAIDVVITVGPNVEVASIGTAPPNVRLERYVPQSLLFPLCSAVICHGGYGTLLAAIEHGIPLVIVPFGADQPINARSVERLGLGQIIRPDELTADSMRHAVRSVLDDPGYRRRVEQVRDKAAALPPATEAVAQIARIVASATGPSP